MSPAIGGIRKVKENKGFSFIRLWRIDADLSRSRRGMAEKDYLWMETH